MASDVLQQNGANVFNSSLELSGSFLHKKFKPKDPVYENYNVLKDCQNATEKPVAVSQLFVPLRINAEKKCQKENIYENADSIQKYLQLQNNSDGEISKKQSIVNGFDKSPKISENKKYRSTLSLTIGRKEDSEKVDDLSLQFATGHETSFLESSSDISNETFKSSYAKSLLDSYQNSKVKNNYSSLNFVPRDLPQLQLSQIESSPSVSSYKESNLPSVVHSSLSSDKFTEEQGKLLSGLHEEVSLKQEELSKVTKELLSLRLECNRLKAENRSLKVAQNVAQRVSPNLSTGDSQPSSLTSVSGDADVWSLQQQVFSLTAQLERAELSRLAYEAATQQLVHFLQTINATLLTISMPDGKNSGSLSNVSLIRTTEMLNHLEKTIRNSSQRITKTKPSSLANAKVEDSFSKESNIPCNSFEGDSFAKKPEFRLRIEDCSESAIVKNKKVTLSKKLEEEKSKANLVKDSKKEDSHRRFSLSHKLWLTSKKKLPRSGSENTLTVNENLHSPKVSRARSSHCISSVERVESSPKGEDEAVDGPSPSNRMSKAKTFFTSLKNIFKATEEDKPHDSSGSLKRKIGFSKKGKVRSESISTTQLISQENKTKIDFPHEHSLDSSTFYVSCGESCQSSKHNGNYCPESSSERGSCAPDSEVTTVTNSSSVNAGISDTEMSGPQEISVSLSLLDKEAEPASPTGYVKGSSVQEGEFIDIPLTDP